MDLRSTLNLPDADFTIPMKADLTHLEPAIQAEWEAASIYHRIQEERKDAPTFVLHDGPPYTNSPIHIGTALNKVLKDFVVKTKTMAGYRAPYVPGYDNHGLPIEQAVMRDFHERGVKPDIVELRKACRAHAAKFIEVQTRQFQRLGVFGLWERPYLTMDYAFEAEIIRIFLRLADRGFVYRGLRPTLWSPTSQTALADTEIVYGPHVSKAIYVRFPLREDPNALFGAYPNLYTVIWTTTPWTIPANLGVAFHPELNYSVVQVGSEHYLVLDSLVEKVAEAVGWEAPVRVAKFLGINLDRAVFGHPIYDRDSVALMADYVTTEDGTGVVHTAPGHGRDDFFTGQAYGLPVLCPVDERGILTAEAGEFAGVSYKECDTVVVDRLRELGNLLAASDYEHSYPFSERDGKPVIFRATEQWFVEIDHESLRSRMIEGTEDVVWYPPAGKNRIQAMIASRPDWCISRQRPWGVGIPIFYGKESRTPVLDPVAIGCVANLVEQEGSDAWFVRQPSEILPEGYAHPETGETEFVKETDVLDVWFDSGCTSLVVLDSDFEPRWDNLWPADLYLEGSDQHRGWFNSSLVIATATKDAPPYRAVLTHGFVTDEKGLKMSKRLGNVVDPVEASDKYGADVLRYWVASVDTTNDVPCSDALLRQMGEHYRSVRNTLRFLLSNLFDYDPEARPELLDLDRWIMERADLLCADVADEYARFEFGDAIEAVHNFCVNELSRFYLDAIKDRMYCDGKDWDSRRSGQAACHYVLVRLVKLVAPLLVHTAEETYRRIPGIEHLDSVHMETFNVPSAARLDEIGGSAFETRFAVLRQVRNGVFTAYEQWKTESGVKDSQDVIATVFEPSETLERLRAFEGELANYFKMSEVNLQEGPSSAAFEPSPYLKCERSRIRRPDVELVDGVPLSARDRKVLGLA